MTELLDELQMLADDMREALITNDSSRVLSLSILQEACLSKVKRHFDMHPEQIADVGEQLKAIQTVMRTNQVLLQNAQDLIHGAIQKAQAAGFGALSYDERV